MKLGEIMRDIIILLTINILLYFIPHLIAENEIL